MPGPSRRSAGNTEAALELMKVALGEAEADLAIVNGDVVNVYTGEVLTGDTVLVKGDRIAYVGKNARQSIGPTTRVIDGTGKTVIPGLIDGHTHVGLIFTISEMVRYALKGGTTTVVTEILDISFALGYRGIIEFLRSIRKQPIRILFAVPVMNTISPVAKEHLLTTEEVGKLLRKREAISLGETYWPPVLEGEPELLDIIDEAKKQGKKLDGHTAGARNNKLQAYASLGFSSCHEPTTAEEVLERLRLGMFVLIREGEIRRELEEIARIKDDNIDFRRLILSSDGLGPWNFTADGYMEFIVQKAINLGFSPVRAIQMATINVAQRFALDDFIGGIAPGKYADMVVIPDLATIQPEYVISNGQVVARNGELLVQPRKHTYPRSIQHTVRLTRSFTADDFAVRVDGNRSKVKVRVIDQTTKLVTREAIIELPVSEGLVLADTSQDTVKVAAIERLHGTGKNFSGFIRGLGLKQGAIGVTTAWDTNVITIVGASEADMAQVVNRIRELNGGIVVCAGGKILAELALPIAGTISPEPMEVLAEKLHHIQQAATDLGCISPDIRLTVSVLTTGAIPFLRICEAGLVDTRQNRFVDLIVG